MGRCVWCGRDSEALKVNGDGVCASCQPQLAQRTLPRSQKIPERATTGFLKGLVRWNAVQRHANEVSRMERQHLVADQPPEAHVLRAYLETRDSLVHRELRVEVQRLMAKAQASGSVREAVATAQKALEAVETVRDAAPDSLAVREMELRVRNFINRVQFESFLKKAQAAEAAGQRRKALAQYRGALFFLLTDDVDDRVQRDQIAMVKEKLQSLMEQRER